MKKIAFRIAIIFITLHTAAANASSSAAATSSSIATSAEASAFTCALCTNFGGKDESMATVIREERRSVGGIALSEAYPRSWRNSMSGRVLAIDFKGQEVVVHNALYAGLERPIHFLYGAENDFWDNLEDDRKWRIDQSWRDPLSGQDISQVVQKELVRRTREPVGNGEVLRLIVDKKLVVRADDNRLVHRAQFFSFLGLVKRRKMTKPGAPLPARPILTIVQDGIQPFIIEGNAVSFRLVSEVAGDRIVYSLTPIVEQESGADESSLMELRRFVPKPNECNPFLCVLLIFARTCLYFYYKIYYHISEVVYE